MSRIYNFSAGPATLPLPVLEQARDEFVDFKGIGMSLVEASHRGKAYDQVHSEAMGLFKELLGLPDNYKVLFLGGGATLQFSMIPLNLLPEGGSCDFTLTGTWSKKACNDAKKVGNVNLVYDGTAEKYTRMPDPSELTLDPNAAYLHLTSNETIAGTQWKAWPDSGAVPLVCDMSSDIMSRPIPAEKFGLIYAGAQKNLGPAGLGVVIIREDLLERNPRDLTAYLSYKTHADADSLYNTPPVFPIWMVKMVLEWVKAQGGLPAMERLAKERSELLYGCMAASSGYYRCPVEERTRSTMNVVWRLPTEDLEKQFIAEALAAGFSGLKGHRSVGGCRASIYNAMPVKGITSLVEFMNEFQRRNG
ncbi:MAG: 3-phosphoserine/phosphohydroxythreonine transaminase [Pseudomonadota bacterium]